MTIKSEPTVSFRCKHGKLWPTAEKAAICDAMGVMSEAHNDDVNNQRGHPGKEPLRLRYFADSELGFVKDGMIDIERAKAAPQIVRDLTRAAQQNERDIIEFWLTNNLTILETMIACYLDREPELPLVQPSNQAVKTEPNP